MQPTDIVIVDALRTPIGELLGQFSSTPAPVLGATCIKALLERTQCPIEKIEASFIGCVLPAGQGQAPARQTALLGGLSNSTHCITVNKMCGSGMASVILGHDALKAGTYQVMTAGGIENMSMAPYLLPKARAGSRMGHQQALDHMLIDGLEDAYSKGTLMGLFAEQCATQYQFSRQEQDAFALESLRKTQEATQQGRFINEIAPVLVEHKGKHLLVQTDELPLNAKPDKIPLLRPAFKTDGSVTAANSSGISDGAAVLLMMTGSAATALKLKPRALIKGHATYAGEPSLFTTAPAFAINKLLSKLDWELSSVSLFEINEAFAVVTMAAIKECKLDPQKVNIYGGACALGHPIGASGARIICTLINALEQTKGRRGIASLCIGGGEACAVAIELI